MSTFYVTTPIYYVNDVPHVGTAYTTVIADAFARYHRARGEKTFFLTGTDEHGEKIEEAAKKNGVAPIDWVNRTASRFVDTWKTMEIANDDFLRTTEPRHAKVVADVWNRLAKAGDLYLGEYTGKYCVGCEDFKTDNELVDGRCPLHPDRPLKEEKKEPSWFFRMSKYQDRLLEHFDRNPRFVLPEVRRNEIVSFIKSGLRDLSVSRTSFTWGIPVPGDPKHVIYVWIDALTNYISALGGPGADKYQTFWPADLQLIGKDILRHHAVYWPCMLLSAGLPLPKTILAHGFLTVGGKKISKSQRVTKIDPNMLAADLGPDALRYFLLREIPLGLDGDFSFEGLIGRFNSDLANDLGNLLNRSLAMCAKNFTGKIPPAHPELDVAGSPHAEIARVAASAKLGAEKAFDELAPSRALESIWELVRGANRYFDAMAPWNLAKDPAHKTELEHVIHGSLEAVCWAAEMAAPAIPGKAREILTQLGLDPAKHAWPKEWNREVPAGTTTMAGTPVFPRIDKDREAALLAKWIPPEAPAVATAAPPAAAPTTVTFEEFSKLELRVALVKAAERIPKKDKLLKLLLDLGSETRQVVAGIGEAYSPESLVGKKVIFLANLAPRKFGPIESQGMVLAAGDEKILGLSSVDVDVPAGTRIR